MQASTFYLDRSSALHTLHPLTKLSLAALCLTAAATLPDIFWVMGVYFLVILPIAALGNVLAPLLRSNFIVIWPFILSLAIIQGFFTPGETTLFVLGRFVFTQEGLLSGLTVAGRLLLALAGTLLMMLSTRPDKLMLALRQRGLPDSFAYIVLTALQIFPRFQDRARVILEAQQARGLETEVNLLRRLRLLVPLIGPLILGSLVEVEERAMALEARAFSNPGRKTSLLRLDDTRNQAILRSSMLFCILLLIINRLFFILGR